VSFLVHYCKYDNFCRIYSIKYGVRESVDNVSAGVCTCNGPSFGSFKYSPERLFNTAEKFITQPGCMKFVETGCIVHFLFCGKKQSGGSAHKRSLASAMASKASRADNEPSL